MKLAIVSFAIEICLARIFVSSWGWAVMIAVLYCIIVFVWQSILIRKQKKNHAVTECEDGMLEYINDNRKSQKPLYDDIHPTVGILQKN